MGKRKADTTSPVPTCSQVNLGRFEPGQSGNPGGRPKAVRPLLEIAREAVPKALEKAVEWLDDKDCPRPMQLEAMKLLCAYGLGRPGALESDSKDLSPQDRPLAGLSGKQLLELARELTRASDGAPPKH